MKTNFLSKAQKVKHIVVLIGKKGAYSDHKSTQKLTWHCHMTGEIHNMLSQNLHMSILYFAWIIKLFCKEWNYREDYFKFKKKSRFVSVVAHPYLDGEVSGSSRVIQKTGPPDKGGIIQRAGSLNKTYGPI